MIVGAVIGVLAALGAVRLTRALRRDDAASFSYGLLERHLRSNAGAPVLLAQALHQHLAERAQAGGAGCGAARPFH